MEQTRLALPSAYNLINSNRSIGYSLAAAIADIIDNSISAGATMVELITPLDSKPRLLIVDNGCGMDQDKLDDAMTFGGKGDLLGLRESTDLGRYGLGLKTASLSQCRKLQVVTKKDGVFCGGCWDLDYVKKTNSWNYLVVSPDSCLELVKNTTLVANGTGTAVIWNGFDRIQVPQTEIRQVFDSSVVEAMKQLELVFHRYLSGEPGINKIQIMLNGRKLEPNDPFLSERNPEVSEPVKINVGNDVIVVKPHKLLHPSRLTPQELDRLTLNGNLIDTQGFYVYRNKRLIIWGTWFRMASKADRTKLCRISIDIPNTLDHVWELDIKKANASPPEYIKNELRKIMEATGAISIRTYTKRAETKKKIVSYWNRIKTPEGPVEYVINEKHPDISQFSDSLSIEQEKRFHELLKHLATYIPIPRLQVDLQNDEMIKNEENEVFEDESSIEERLKVITAAGVPIESIENAQPFCKYPKLLLKWKEKEGEFN